MSLTMTQLRTITMADATREGLTEAALRDPSVILIAQGVDDPTSVFGTTKGIAGKLGRDRLIEMPISENALTGVAVGAALSGKRPVLSFHRVEFALLAMEQIANNAAKSHYISEGRHRVPLIRLIAGRDVEAVVEELEERRKDLPIDVPIRRSGARSRGVRRPSRRVRARPPRYPLRSVSTRSRRA